MVCLSRIIPNESACTHVCGVNNNGRKPDVHPVSCFSQFELTPIQHFEALDKLVVQLPPPHHWKRLHAGLAQQAAAQEAASVAEGKALRPTHWRSVLSLE